MLPARLIPVDDARGADRQSWLEISEGDVLRTARLSRGWSAETLAGKIDRGLNWIYKCEKNQGELSEVDVGKLRDLMPEAWLVITRRRIARFVDLAKVGDDERAALNAFEHIERSAALRRDLETIVRAAQRQLERLP